MQENHEQRRPSSKIPSTWAWLAIHVWLPLVPYLTACLVRFVSNPCLSWVTFDLKELALSLSLASLFVRQSLSEKEILLPNPEKRDEVAGAAALCWFPVAIFFALFTLIEAFSTLIHDRNLAGLQDSLAVLQVMTLILSAFFLSIFVLIQRSFKLKARFQ